MKVGESMPEDIKIVLSEKMKIRSRVNTVSKGTLDPDVQDTEFTISFNKNVDAALLNKATVYIIDKNGDYLRTEIKKVEPEKRFVLRPLEKYKEDYPYYLVIAPNTKTNENNRSSIFVNFILRDGKVLKSQILKAQDPAIAEILQKKDISQFAERNVRIITETDLISKRSDVCNKVVDNSLIGCVIYLTEESLILKGRISKVGEAPKMEQTFLIAEIKEIIPTMIFNEFILTMKNGERVQLRTNDRDKWIKDIKALMEKK